MAQSRELQIILDLKDNASKELNKVGGVLQKNAANFKKIGAGLTLVGGAITAVSYKFVKLASDAEEIQSKFNVVFRGMEKETNDWANSFANDVGRARQDIKKFSSGIADVLKPMGLQTKAAAEMSKKMVELALDVASFNNRQDEDVIRSFTSALTGERESLKTLGIVIQEADVQAEMLLQRKEGLTFATDKEAKAQATLNLLYKQTRDAQGDLARTSDSFANKQKKLNAQLKNMSEEIGNVLLPIASKLVGKLSEIVSKVVEWSAKHPKLTEGIVLVVAGLGVLFAVLGPIVFILPTLITLINGVGVALAFVAANPIVLIIAAIIALVAAIVWLIKNWGKVEGAMGGVWMKIKEMFNSGVDFVKEKIDKMIGFFTNLIDKVKGAIGAVKGFFSTQVSNIGEAFTNLPENIGLTPLASGGIVTGPTPALVGEAGPEAIIPLNKINSLGGGITVNVYGDVSGQELIDKVSQGIANKFSLNQRVNI